MSVIVKDKETGKEYIYLGAGYAAYESAVRISFLGHDSVQDNQGEIPMIAVCDQRGQIGWFYSDELEVVSVDGNNPYYILNK